MRLTGVSKGNYLFADEFPNAKYGILLGKLPFNTLTLESGNEYRYVFFNFLRVYHDHAMTVCVGIKVRDCIVFAADSAMSITGTTPNGEPTVLNIWNHGLKVFNLCKGLPIVAMTAGMANFGPISVSNLTKDLRHEFSKIDGGYSIDTKSYSMEDVVKKAEQFFKHQYDQQQTPIINPPPFHFWIGGYGSTDSHGEIWEISIRGKDNSGIIQHVKAEDDDRVLWGGQLEAISRLILGMSPSVPNLLSGIGLDGNKVDEIKKLVTTPLVHPAMPVQDAIDLADFLVETTKRYSAFLPRANIVGGDTDIATVTKHEGFKWIKRKHYYSEHLNRRNTDHV